MTRVIHKSRWVSSRTGAGWSDATALRTDGREHFWPAWKATSLCGLATDHAEIVLRHVRPPGKLACVRCCRLMEIRR